MSANALKTTRFVRRTQLGPNEYRKNFRQLDGDIISAVTSTEADRVTPLMSKIYLRLVNAPARYWERDGVLRFEAELRDDKHVKAWAALCEAVGVASATASKALRWMHDEGIIGYFAGKNGVGIRIFLNRAVASIGTKSGGQKILAFPQASSRECGGSADEAAFNDSFAVSKVLETDLNPHAPKNGADDTGVFKNLPDSRTTLPRQSVQGSDRAEQPQSPPALQVEEIVSRIRLELEPALQSAARRAASQEHERTREWLETKGLPKAVRVAQRETYNVLRQYGLATAARHTSAGSGVGWQTGVQEVARPLSPQEVRELAESCAAMLEVHGQTVEATLAALSVGGVLLGEDASKVCALAQALASGEGKGVA